MADVTGTASPASDREMVQDVVNALSRAMKNVTFYPPEHPQVAEMTAEAARAVGRAVARGECLIKFIGANVVLDDRPLFDMTSSIGSLVGACHNRGIDAVTFVPGVKPNEVSELIKVLTTDPDEVSDQGGASAVLGRRGVTHVSVDALQAVAEGAQRRKPTSLARGTYAGALDVMRGAVRRAGAEAPLNIEGAERAVDRLIDAILREQSAMLGLVSVKNYDEYTFTHALHICILCLGLGHAIGLSHDKLKELGIAALLHDVGKVFVPLEILRKPDKLTPEEFKAIARHPVDGALLLFRQERAPAVAPVVAFEHHIQCNGTGYPQVNGSWELNLYSLIVSIADVYDALTTERPYRPPLSPEQALEMMHESRRGQFDERLLGRFTEMLGKYPAGTLVRLSNGDPAIVSRPNPANAARPFLHHIVTDDGRVTLGGDELDTTQRDPETGEYVLSIVQVLDPVAERIEVASLLGQLAQRETT
ncbi:MAG: HD-GYP domain-containing protein [Armatimonadota bacterium]|nr:MAG: HD-GYP domain-containing protein [Armatimonadota bacterium]